MQPGAVVPGDLLDRRSPDPGGPGSLVDQFALQRGEEPLGEGVVPALTGPPGREDHLAVVGEGGVRGRGVLLKDQVKPGAGAATGAATGCCYWLQTIARADNTGYSALAGV